ncbi:MAG: hypothetical protein JST31_03815 [Actinobacteria bacterium]|nr:hypothetical protein [Actinomycetota bacterium]
MDASYPRYEERGEPAIRSSERDERRHLTNYRCPYCGGQSLLISYGDIPEDKYRIELYCENSSCVVREMTIIALCTDTAVSQDRADVRALHVVDRGTEEEQVAEGYELIRDEAGNVIGRGISAGTMLSNTDFGASTLRRRQRPTTIQVGPD